MMFMLRVLSLAGSRKKGGWSGSLLAWLAGSGGKKFRVTWHFRQTTIASLREDD